MVNLLIVYRENRRKATYPQKNIVSEYPLHTKDELVILRETSIIEGLSILIPPGFLGLYKILNSHRILFAWLPWNIPFLSNLGWGGFVAFFVVIDIFYQGLIAMPRQRYG
jgi:hypothetical protein